MRDQAQDLFAFWENARRGRADRVALQDGRLVNGGVEAPIAIYRHSTRRRENQYLIIQHGSYQFVPIEEQPEVEAGHVLLHRGIGDGKVYLKDLQTKNELTRIDCELKLLKTQIADLEERRACLLKASGRRVRAGS